MFRLFHLLRQYQVPVSIRELLDLLGVLRAGTPRMDRTAFYFLARLTLVKDERFYDRFDRAYAHFIDGLETLEPVLDTLWPDRLEEQLAAWLGSRTPLTPAERAALDALVSDYRTRIADQRSAARAHDGTCGHGDAAQTAAPGRPASSQQHHDSEHDVGDGETGDAAADTGDGGEHGDDGRDGSGEQGEDGQDGRGPGGDGPAGVDGEAASGIRDAHTEAPRARATRIWTAREFAELDDRVELGTRTFKVALRRLRRMARTDPEQELDLDATIAGTARGGGILDIHMRPLRRNSVKVILLLDTGGSMDEHVELVERLFVAARSEFKYLEEYWFHNCVYDGVWRDSRRRPADRIDTHDLLRRYGRDWKVVLVGDAHMHRDELATPGGSLEHANAEAGAVWIGRLRDRFARLAWINPRAEDDWQASLTIPMVRSLIDQHMYPLTNEGLERAMRTLAR